MEETIIRGIATREGYHFFRVTVPLGRLLAALKGERFPLRFFSSSGGEVRFVCERERIDGLKSRLEANGLAYEETPRVALISAVGDGLSSSSEELPRFLETLEATGAECFLVCANSLSITAAIPLTHKEQAARDLHARLIENA
jgi:aspartokinase